MAVPLTILVVEDPTERAYFNHYIDSRVVQATPVSRTWIMFEVIAHHMTREMTKAGSRTSNLQWSVIPPDDQIT